MAQTFARRTIVGMVLLALVATCGSTRAIMYYVAACGSTRATTYYVDLNGSDGADGLTWATAFATIQKCINTATDGDIVEVNEGTYYAAVNFKGVGCTLTSTNSSDWDVVGNTIIDGNGAANTITLDSGEDATSILKGFTITGGITGVLSSLSSPVISNCIIEDNTDVGVYCKYSSATIKNNIIRRNTNNGLYVQYSGVSVKNNIISNNVAGLQFGYATAYSTVWNNTIVDNTSYGINVAYVASPTISNCIVWDCNDDLYGCSATYSCIQDGDGGTGNICSDPCFVDADNNDFHISIHSPCVNRGNPDGNYAGQTDIDGDPRVIGSYVDMGADEVNVPVSDAHQWGLDEKSGTIAYDSVSNSDGNFNGNDPCWVDGLIGGAIDCNGVSDYFSVSSLDGNYDSNSTFSIAGWFKTTQTTGKQTIVGQWFQFLVPYPPSAPSLWYGWQVLVENKKVVAQFGNGNTTADITGTKDVNDGYWHHFALVYPTSSSNATLYVDGNSEGTPSGQTFTSTTSTKFRIGDGSYMPTGGASMTKKGGPFCGTIDDIMLFERALSADEVKQLYDYGS